MKSFSTFGTRLLQNLTRAGRPRAGLVSNARFFLESRLKRVPSGAKARFFGALGGAAKVVPYAKTSSLTHSIAKANH